MEAATAHGVGGRAERLGGSPQPAYLAEAGPGFIHPEEHARQMDDLRSQATEAAEFHARKLREAQAVIASVDAGMSTLSEVRSKDEAPLPSRY